MAKPDATPPPAPSPSPTANPAPRFTLRQLHYFVAAARCGQISVAAAEVAISQSAMTLAGAGREGQRGAPLFERGRHGVALTHEGHAFLQHAQALLQAAAEAQRLPFHRPSSLSGRLELAATYTVQGYYLLPAVARFRQLYPQVQVVPVELPRPEIERRLRDGRLALAALLLSNLAEPAALHTQVLARSRRQLWVAAGHELAGRSAVRWDEVARHPYIVPMMDEADRNARAYWREAGVRPVSMIRTSSMEALREMVALGLGVTVLSDMVFRPWSLDGRRIQAVPVDARLPVMAVGLAWGRDRPLSPCAQALRDFLLGAASVGRVDDAVI